ncbi:uncharacterized protein SAPINGB_P004714 [Magnusiomyces paraingens]|uniref:Methylthioribose-1-phosphate isomerase n=1 Tax=Magnusiomyces paraingens TaxID=2606893 RepID=A0A5E8C1B8_9ASCO|nr:uncharacterized protein SAPINGB_P004714 [Saprochaete ingens]VVT55740.1 unnamed protein product [Saprochaete ingens]
MSKTLQAIKFDSGDRTLEILDQLKLPHISEYVSIKDTKDGFDAIRSMTVRGAPAIAIVAALSLAVELNKKFVVEPTSANAEEVATYVKEKLAYLVESRPTAVNLSRAAKDLTLLVDENKNNGSGKDLAELVIKAAEAMLEADVADNKAIGKNGAEWAIKQLLLPSDSSDSKFSALTICNTGSLATAGYGTALGIIRSLYSSGRLDHTYACETRPYNQGSRLTAYELVYDQIPATLITDNMATALLSQRERGPRGESHAPVRLIVVGADRVARNGDTANKIGTHQLAVLAKHFNKQGDAVRFVVAAPTTSIDLNTATGADIVIEERPQHELVQVRGPEVIGGQVSSDSEHRTVHVAAPGIDVWNPAFDVTPHALIDAIVTERGVAEKNAAGDFDLDVLF